MLEKVDDNFFKKYKHALNDKPYFIFDFNNSKKVIHNVQFFLETIKKNKILFIKFKEDYIYLININKTYKYAYGYYIKGMENW